MLLILNHNEPDDFVCATGKSHTVDALVNYVFTKLKISRNQHLEVDQKFFRPEELEHLRGDPSKKKILNWKHEYSFEDMLDEMIESKMNYYSK